jgi:hypothetical protein
MFRSISHAVVACSLMTLGAAALPSRALADATPTREQTPVTLAGADLHIHNKTGKHVELYIFEDDRVHKTRAGGVHAGDLNDGETGTAHVKACHFAVVLFAGNDAYHAEFKDCSITDITITASNKG